MAFARRVCCKRWMFGDSCPQKFGIVLNIQSSRDFEGALSTLSSLKLDSDLTDSKI